MKNDWKRKVVCSSRCGRDCPLYNFVQLSCIALVAIRNDPLEQCFLDVTFTSLYQSRHELRSNLQGSCFIALSK